MVPKISVNLRKKKEKKKKKGEVGINFVISCFLMVSKTM